MAQQDNRFASVTTPLGTDILLFSRMTGTEEMSRLFEYELDLLVENKNVGSIVTAGFPTDKAMSGTCFSCPTFPQRNMLMPLENVLILYFCPLNRRFRV